VSAAAVAGFISLSGSPYLVVAQRTAWALDNIADDGLQLGDLVIYLTRHYKSSVPFDLLDTLVNLLHFFIE
jgi:hypothetical protein